MGRAAPRPPVGRATRTRTSTRAQPSNVSETAVATALQILIDYERLSHSLPHLHDLFARAVGATRSLLLQREADGPLWQVLSARGVDAARPIWKPRTREARAIDAVFRRDTPVYEATLKARYPSLTQQLGATRTLLVPLSQRSERLGLLVLEVTRRPTRASLTRVRPFADSIALALARARLSERIELHRHIREMLRAFSEAVSTALDLTAGLDALCLSAKDVFGANRTSVWLHERRQRELVLAASSEPVSGRQSRVPTSDLTQPAARGLRRVSAELEPMPADDGGADANLVLVPLRGRRRALGTVVLEGVGQERRTGADLLSSAQEFGWHLSGAVENVQLLQDVIQSRRELENTFNSIADLVAVCDRQLRLAHVNRAFAQRVGVPREALLDLPLSDFVGPTVSRWMADMDLDAASEPTGPATRETDDPMLGGTFSVTLTRLLDQGGDPRGLVMVARDITERARLEAERTALREQLAQSEKLAALGQFVAGIAHELNNPLQGVLGHIELLNATTKLPSNIRREFRTVSREAERAAKIVRNLLVFAGSRKLARRRFSLNAVVGRALDLRAGSCREAHIEVVRTYGAAVPRISGDPLLLQQALLNILINAEHAVTATPSGRIEVTTHYNKRRRIAAVRVRDNGPGLSAEILPRIFEPFYTTKEVGKGTGLGLAITYGIIQEHGGQITAASDAHGGAVFTVELPTDKRVTRRT